MLKLYRLTADEDLAVEDAMWKRGQKETTTLDRLVYKHLGKDLYDKLVESVFTYTCLESEYLRQEKVGDMFRKMCLVNRQVMLQSVVDQLQYLIDRHIDFVPMEEDDMKKHIRQKYHSAKALEVEFIS
jgi:hypothetical protein